MLMLSDNTKADIPQEDLPKLKEGFDNMLMLNDNTKEDYTHKKADIPQEDLPKLEEGFDRWLKEHLMIGMLSDEEGSILQSAFNCGWVEAMKMMGHYKKSKKD